MRAPPSLRFLPIPISPRPLTRLPAPFRQFRPSSTTQPLSVPGPPKPHPIVSSFLCTGTEGTPTFRIALFKRSDKVPLYKNLYAGISGSIETSDTSPFAAALREIKEETGLAPPAIELLREGEAYDVDDGEVGKRWRIFTFAWRLHEPGERHSGGGGGAENGSGDRAAGRAGAKEGEDGEEEGKEKEGRLRALMTLCEANVAVVFVRPEEVAGMDTVPDLARGIRAVVRGHFGDE
ncbi:Initiation factor 2B-like protein [Trapelia coarctata]|nr:Initiation factor 2B-like protein [Trapelia coarctata]